MVLQLMLDSGSRFTTADATGLVLTLFQWLLVAVAILYVFVAVIISRQIGLMRATVTTPHTRRLQFISYVHLALSVILSLYFVLFL